MSKSSSMSSDRVSTTASEGRKSSKPIMEKKRRARINASLAELKSLLLEVIKKEGARHSKMEKADILEMAVKHLRQIQRQQYISATGVDPTLSDKYRLGYNECAQEVSRYLGATEEDDAELRAKLLNHLANCITSSDSASSASSSPAPTVASPEPTSPSSSTSMSPHRASGGCGDLRSQQVSSSGAENAIGQSGIVSPVLTPVPVRAGFALTSAPGGSGGGDGSSALPHAFLLPASSAEINNNIATLANNNVILSAGPDAFAGFRNVSQHVTLTTATPAQASFPAGHSVQKVIGELVMPPNGSGGEVAFVLPASHYIIYASPTPGLAAGAMPFAATASASTAVSLPLLGAGPGGGGLVALGAGMSPALLPQTTVSHVVATSSLGAPVMWHQTATPVYASSSSNSSISPAHSSSSFSSPNGQQSSTSSSLTSSSPSSSSWSPSSSSSGAFASDTCLSTISPRSSLGLMSISDRPTVIASAQPLQLTTLPGRRFESTAGPSSSSFSTASSSSTCASLLFPQPHAFSAQQALNPQPLNLSPRAFRGLASSALSGLGQVTDEVCSARPARGGEEDRAAVGGRTACLQSQLGKRRSPTPPNGPEDETEHGPWRPW